MLRYSQWVVTSKTSIDRLGVRLRGGPLSRADLELLDSYRSSFRDAYLHVYSTIQRTTGSRPTGRPAKSTTSIIEKLRRETIRLSQMQDIAGCRIVVESQAKQDKVTEQVLEQFPGASVDDRRVRPSHGYRAVHIIPIVSGKPVEIQVRTELQHGWAELSEKFSDLIDPRIKYGEGPETFTRFLEELSVTFRNHDRESERLETEVHGAHIRLENLTNRLETTAISEEVRQKARAELASVQTTLDTTREKRKKLFDNTRREVAELIQTLERDLEAEH